MTAPAHVAVDRLDAVTSRRLERVIDAAVPAVAPALALCVWQSGELRYEVNAGWIDPEAATDEVDSGARFDLASLTKLFTSSTFLGLVSDGLVALDDPVVDTLPDLGASGPRAVDGGQEPLTRRLLPTPFDRVGWTVDPSLVTWRELLTHTSGLAPWRSVFREAGPVPPPPWEPDPVPVEARWDAALATVLSYPFVARPGTEVHYSDLGFMLLGAAIARLSGRSLDDALADRILTPLRLETVGYRPLDRGVPLGQVVPTSVDSDWRGRRCRGEVEDENAAGLGGVAGHAGLFAAARDVARFGQAWLSADQRLGRRPDLLAEAITDQTPGMAEARGLGWQVQPTDHLAPFGPRAFGHTGFTGTSLAVDPERDLVVALLTNRVYAGRSHEGIDELRLGIHETLVGA